MMAQASMRKVLSETLARRIVAICHEPAYLFAPAGDEPDELCGALDEDWLIARLCGVSADVEAEIGKIERARAKEAR